MTQKLNSHMPPSHGSWTFPYGLRFYDRYVGLRRYVCAFAVVSEK